MALRRKPSLLQIGTEGRIRTDTPLLEPDFESGASTSFATPAFRSGPTKTILMELLGFGLTIFYGDDFNIVDGGQWLVSL